MMATENEVCNALLEIIKQESSPDIIKAKNLLLRRMAEEERMIPSRIPAPINISEIGGYINLLEKHSHGDLSYKMLASVLGVPISEYSSATFDREPILFFSTVLADRPACPQVSSLPLSFTMRIDFLQAFNPILATARALGGAIPICCEPMPLPGLSESVPMGDSALRIVGRTLELAPTAAFLDPASDPIVVEKSNSGGNIRVLLRIKEGARSSVSAYKILEETVELVETTGIFVSADELLAKAGWYPLRRSDSGTIENLPSVLNYYNMTSLFKNRTTFGDDLRKLFSDSQISASSAREVLNAIWNGSEFILNTL